MAARPFLDVRMALRMIASFHTGSPCGTRNVARRHFETRADKTATPARDSDANVCRQTDNDMTGRRGDPKKPRAQTPSEAGAWTYFDIFSLKGNLNPPRQDADDQFFIRANPRRAGGGRKFSPRDDVAWGGGGVSYERQVGNSCPAFSW